MNFWISLALFAGSHASGAPVPCLLLGFVFAWRAVGDWERAGTKKP